MKITQIIAVSILILICGCSSISSTTKAGNPDWVSKRITEFQNAPIGNPPQSIWRYEYNSQTVYYLPPQCCDQFSQLYDTSGKLICAPDGGFGGKGNGKCPDFFKTRKNETLIWRDPRSK
jgi:hypothetical protein